MTKNMKSVLVATGVALGAFIINEEVCGASYLREEDNVDYGPLRPEPNEEELITFKDLTRFYANVSTHWRNIVISQKEVKECLNTAIREESKKDENQKLDSLIQYLLVEINKRDGDDLFLYGGIWMKDKNETVWGVNLQQMLQGFLHPAIVFNAYKIKEFKDLRKILDKKIDECEWDPVDAEKLKTEICISLRVHCNQENCNVEALKEKLKNMSIVEQLATAYEYLDGRENEKEREWCKQIFTHYFGNPYICLACGIERSPMAFYEIEDVLDMIYPGWRMKKQKLQN